MGSVVEAGIRVGLFAQKLQNSQQPLAMILSDRSALDGYVFSEARCPKDDQEMIDLRKVGADTGMLLVNPRQQPVAYRELIRRDFGQQCDRAVIVNHEEVAFEPSEMRPDDLEFRAKIADDMQAYYIDTLGPDKVDLISGNRMERVTTLRSTIRILLETTM